MTTQRQTNRGFRSHGEEVDYWLRIHQAMKASLEPGHSGETTRTMAIPMPGTECGKMDPWLWASEQARVECDVTRHMPSKKTP